MKYLTNFLTRYANKPSKLLKLKVKALRCGLKIKHIINVSCPCITTLRILLQDTMSVLYPRITWKKRTIRYDKNLIKNRLNTDNAGTLNLSSLTSSTERQFTEMLTLERKVSHVKQLAKQIDPNLEIQEIEPKNSTRRTNSNKSVRELLSSGNLFIKLFAEKIENNWQEQVEEEKLQLFKELLLKTNEAIEELQDRTHWKINKKGFGKPSYSLNVKKELRMINKSLMYLSQVLSDTIEFVNIASEITELRSKPVAESESDKIQQILARSKEIARQKKELPRQEVKKGMEDILEAMKKT